MSGEQTTFKSRDERQAGDKFIAWLNTQRGSTYTLARLGRNSEPHKEPDLLYVDSNRGDLWMEVSAVHFGNDEGKFEAMHAQQRPDAPKLMRPSNPQNRPRGLSESLRESLISTIEKKAKKTYSNTPILVLHHPDRFLDKESVEAMLTGLPIPSLHPFSEIFFLVTFYTESYRTQVWKLF